MGEVPEQVGNVPGVTGKVSGEGKLCILMYMH
jgi:hypothetical protein